jgi:hypothetical protein
MSAVAEQSVVVSRPVPAAPQSTPCPRCSSPIEPGDTFCPNCGAPVESATAASPEADAPARIFRCENCGASVRYAADTRTTDCPFCATPYVIAPSPAETGRQEPEFVIGFAVPPDKAESLYRDWLGRGGLFRPGDLRQAARPERLRGIYLPFWSFSMRANSDWSAQIGEYWYRTETYTTTDAKGNTTMHTRRVQETEWWPLRGRHHSYHNFYLVSGSKGLPQAVSLWVQPFQLLALKRYSPRYLAGWLSEEYSVTREQAYPICEAEYRAREAAQVAAFLPGDTHSSVNVETTFSQVNSDLILLPHYLISYRYRDRLYRTLINGQTGRIAGERPVSGRRVVAAVAAVLALIALIVLLVNLFGGGR